MFTGDFFLGRINLALRKKGANSKRIGERLEINPGTKEARKGVLESFFDCDEGELVLDIGSGLPRGETQVAFEKKGMSFFEHVSLDRIFPPDRNFFHFREEKKLSISRDGKINLVRGKMRLARSDRERRDKTLFHTGKGVISKDLGVQLSAVLGSGE